MKNNLHTTTYYPVPSFRVAKRIEKPTSHKIACFVTSSLSRNLIRSLAHSLTLSCFLFLFSGLSFAQNYDWDWAISGGSPNGNESATGILNNSEQIYDVKTGGDGNYYYIATMKGLNQTQLDGQPVTVYNQSLGSEPDIFLFSTTCDGQVRWSQSIGGGINDTAYNLVLDSNNNVYVGAYVRNVPIQFDGRAVHFSPTDSLPLPVPNNTDPYGLIPQEGYKTLYLLKYDHNGVFKKKKALQGDTTMPDGMLSRILDLAIDSQDRLHFIVGLKKGTHLDGNVTVPVQYASDPSMGIQGDNQYYLGIYDNNLDYVNSILLPIADGSGFPLGGTIRFAYDETLNRYYVAGMRSGVTNDPPISLTYDGDAFEERSFVLAFNGTDGSEVWRREIYSDPNPQFGYIQENRITSLLVDANSDVYVAGTFFTYDQNPLPIKIYDPSDPQVTPYIFTPGIYARIPTVVKFNSSGAVQWAKTPTAYGSNFTTSGTRQDRGLAVRGNEIAFGSPNGYYIWDSFVYNPPQFRRPDAALMRFDKQTGSTIGMHIIEGDDADSAEFTTAVAVDNDGNYVVGGAFYTTLFGNNPNINQLVTSGGNDFFVAKLAASVCGTPVSTEEFNSIAINVFPNPTANIVNVETTEPLAGYVIYDALGRLVRESMFGNNNQINLETASNGVYFIKVTTQNGNVGTVKVVKE